MSWLDRIENKQLIIQTGDGEEYTPIWINAKKNIKYNTEAYDFIGVGGTYVQREQRQGTQYSIELYFQGEDCIEDAAKFEVSARDKRLWTITHPLYDSIKAQPLSLQFDNSAMNIVKVTGTIWETLLKKYPSDDTSAEKEVTTEKETLDTNIQGIFVYDLGTPDSSLVTPTQSAVTIISDTYEESLSDSDAIQTLKNYTRLAAAAATNLISDTDSFVSSIIDLINFPFEVEQTIQTKVEELLSNIDTLVDTLVGISGGDVMYSTIATVSFTEIARNVISSDSDDYNTRSDVLELVEEISDAYDDYLGVLDDNDISLDPETAKSLDYCINVALAYLFDVAFDAKQERTYILEEDNNIINLAHRFIGPGDDNLNTFISQNDITLNEYLGLAKGRKIKYYV